MAIWQNLLVMVVNQSLGSITFYNEWNIRNNSMSVIFKLMRSQSSLEAKLDIAILY